MPQTAFHAYSKLLVVGSNCDRGIVLLNKPELVDQGTLAAMEKSLAPLAPNIRIIRCTNAEALLSVLFVLAGTSSSTGFECASVGEVPNGPPPSIRHCREPPKAGSATARTLQHNQLIPSV